MPVFWHWEISPKPHRTSYSDPTTERPEKFQGKLVTVTAPRGNSGVKSIAGTIAKNTTVKIHQGPRDPRGIPLTSPIMWKRRPSSVLSVPAFQCFPRFQKDVSSVLNQQANIPLMVANLSSPFSIIRQIWG